MSHLLSLGQPLALTAYVQAVEARLSSETNRAEPLAAGAFLMWADMDESAFGESDSWLQKSSFFKGVYSLLGLCRSLPVLVILNSQFFQVLLPLLVIRSGCRRPVLVSVIPGLSCNTPGCLCQSLFDRGDSILLSTLHPVIPHDYSVRVIQGSSISLTRAARGFIKEN